jgi:twinkle protein
MLQKMITDAKPYPVSGLFRPLDLRNEVMLLYDKGADRGAPTGWNTLDPYYSVRPGELTIITGIPGAGKSNWVDQLCINLAASQGWAFAMFSPENWPIQQHIKVLLEKITGKPFSQNGQAEERMSREEVDQNLELLNDYFYFIVPEEDILSVETILEKARVTVFRHGVRGIVIDPWNEVEHLLGNLTEAQYLSHELTKIRRFARMNSVHIWIVAHPRNLVKDKITGDYRPPTMYEISGGAHWRNKADNGICIHRPDYNRDESEIMIQKIRFREVGQIGKVTLRYSRDSGEYFE